MTRYWAAVLAAWAAVLVATLVIAPRISAIGAQDDAAFLPGTVASQQAADIIQTHFDRPPAMSVAAVILERPEGLTGMPPTATQPAGPDSDWGYIARLTLRLRQRAEQADPKWNLMSAGDPRQGFLRGILVSAAGRATVIKVDLPCGFASREAISAVDWIEEAVAAAKPPAGLNIAVTGSASYGRDCTRATETSLKRTTWAAAIAVVLILLVTYRALPVVGISLTTVTVAVLVAVSIVAIGASFGWSVSVLVELFTIIIGFGAGVDFSLFFLSRYHEELGRYNGLDTRPDRRAAIVRVMVSTGPAIVASAGTVAAALGLMYFADFPVFHTAGPAVSISIIVACAASLTLAPALAYLVGSRTFWPRRVTKAPSGTDPSGGLWNRIAAFAVRRHVLVLVVGLVVLVPLALLGWKQDVVYDTLADLPQTDQSVRGAGIFQRHFPIGEMSPVQIVVHLDRPLSEADWTAVALAVDRKLAGLPVVRQVRSLAHPLGLNGPEISPEEVSVLMATVSATTAPQDGPSSGTPKGDLSRPRTPMLSGIGRLLGIPPDSLAKKMSELKEAGRMFKGEVLPRHLGRERSAALWEVALPWPPYGNRAMDALAPLAQTVRDAVREASPAPKASPRVLIAGDTALMRDLRQVTTSDFWFVGALAVATIILIVTLLIRDLAVALFVMLATILTYGAALGLTSWAFHLLFGIAGPDWKVEFFLFVILVAVGQDYNLFMLTRIMEERRAQPLRPAVQAAIARTGSIISYCGLTMAATLGSLATSPLRLLQELGTAFIVGLLIDTFLVRPLMVPAFILVFRRMKHPNPLARSVTWQPRD